MSSCFHMDRESWSSQYNHAIRDLQTSLPGCLAPPSTSSWWNIWSGLAAMMSVAAQIPLWPLERIQRPPTHHHPNVCYYIVGACSVQKPSGLWMTSVPTVHHKGPLLCCLATSLIKDPPWDFQQVCVSAGTWDHMISSCNHGVWWGRMNTWCEAEHHFLAPWPQVWLVR